VGFVKSFQEIMANTRATADFYDAEMLTVFWETKPEIIAKLLPPPLKPAKDNIAMAFVANYPRTNFDVTYKESALFVRALHNGEEGSYCLAMPVTNDMAMAGGREVYGFPKKMANIHLEKAGKRAHGWVERYGIRFVEIDATLTGTIPELPPMGPTFLFKAMPRIDLTPGFDGPVFLAAQRTEIVARSVEIGTADLTLRPSEQDPWAEIEDPKVTAAFYLESDNTMLPGKILAEVDPERHLPHYFKMTDFHTGDS